MKAIVKATGEIVEVHTTDDADFIDGSGRYYWERELFFGYLDVNSYDNPNYWTRLEHQYAGMAMQGMLNNSLLISSLLKVGKSHEDIVNEVTGTAVRYAHALVEKMKEERK